MSKVLKPNPKGKRKGVGGKFARDDIDWDVAEQYYIQGEIIREQGNGNLVRKPVSMSDVARKFNCSVSLVHYWAKKRQWKKKREDYEALAQRELNEAVAKARAMSFAEAAGILDSWLVKFQAQLEADKVRVDSLSDFNIAMRLKRFIEEQPKADDPGANSLSLEGLQRKHRAARARRAKDDGTTGVLPGEGDAIH
jgi:hypothetical protein